MSGGWYKRADSPYYSRRIRDLRLNKDKTKSRLLRLFDYIKRNKKMTASFFHGTSVNIWENIKKSGYFTSPKIRNVADREARTKGLEEVFFTTDINYSMYYADRSADQDGSKPIILHLEIPLIWIKEVSDVILGTESIEDIYNEYGLQKKIKKIIDNPDASQEQMADDILDFFIDTYFQNSSNEFTIKHSVPVRFVKQTTLGSKSLLEQAIQAVVRNNGQEEYKLHRLIPEYWKNDPEILSSLNPERKQEHDDQIRHELQESIVGFFGYTDKQQLQAYKSTLNVLTDPEHRVSKEKAQQSLRDAFSFQFTNYSIDSLFHSIIPSLANGKPLRSLVEEFGISDLFVSYIKNTIKHFHQGFDDMIEYADNHYYEKVVFQMGSLENNIYTLESLNIINKQDLNNLKQKVAHAGRAAYLRGLVKMPNPTAIYNLYTNYSFPDKKLKMFSMPPLDHDPEAMKIAQKRIRELYIERVKRIGEISESIENDLGYARSLYSQQPIEQDEEAQRVFVNGVVTRITNSTANDRRRSYYPNTMERINKELIELESNKFPNLTGLPDWIGLKPEFRKDLIQAYRSIYSYYLSVMKKLNPELIHPYAKQDEFGNPVNYEKQSIIDKLNENDKSFTMNLNYVKNDPELFELYKKNVLNRLSAENAGIEFVCSMYVIFSGTKGIPKDEVLYKATSDYIRKIIENNKNIHSIRSINDMIANHIEGYNIFLDPNFGEAAKRNLLEIAKLYYETNGFKSFNSIGISLQYKDLLQETPELDKTLLEMEEYYCIKLMNKYKDFYQVFELGNYILDRYKKEWSPRVLNLIGEKISVLFPLYCKEGVTYLGDLNHYLESSLFSLFQNDNKFVTAVLGGINIVMEKLLSKDGIDLISINHHIATLIASRNNAYSNLMLEDPKFSDIYVQMFCKASERIIKAYSSVSDRCYFFSSVMGSMPNALQPIVFRDPRAIPYLEAYRNAEEEKKKIIQNMQNQKSINNQQGSLANGYAWSNGWYNMIKQSDELFSLNEENQDKIYDTFRNTYEKSTGQSWSKDKFFSRANNWRFYGDESGYITVREQGSGMLKLTGMAGSMKGIYKGMQDLISETVPIWGMVAKNIAGMAAKVGFIQADPNLVKENIYKIPSGVFGGAKIKGVLPDGGVQFEYSDVGPCVKYLIGNQAYFSLFMGS